MDRQFFKDVLFSVFFALFVGLSLGFAGLPDHAAGTGAIAALCLGLIHIRL